MSTPLRGRPDLTGRTALITGASRGIGAATACYLAECGADLALASRDSDALSALADELTARGGRAIAITLDVTDDDAVAAAVARVEQEFGQLDLAFNNAGAQGPALPLHQQDLATARHITEVNLFGVLHAMRHEIPAMLRAGGGVIVNTASVGGLIAAPGIGPYCASKHAVIGLSKSAAIDYAGAGIRINVLAPGSVRTDILTGWLDDERQLDQMKAATPQQRIAEATEIAPVVGWLLSEASSFMTGSVVTADGGYTAL